MDDIIHFVDAQGQKQKETRHTTAEMRDFVRSIKPPAKLITVLLGDRVGHRGEGVQGTAADVVGSVDGRYAASGT